MPYPYALNHRDIFSNLTSTLSLADTLPLIRFMPQNPNPNQTPNPSIPNPKHTQKKTIHDKALDQRVVDSQVSYLTRSLVIHEKLIPFTYSLFINVQ